MGKKWIWFVPAVIAAVGIFALSTFLSVPIEVEGVNHLDKWQHALAYLVLSSSFLFAFKKSTLLSRKLTMQVILIAGLYGLFLEFVQYQFFSRRFFDWADALANVLGALLGFVVFRLANKVFHG